MNISYLRPIIWIRIFIISIFLLGVGSFFYVSYPPRNEEKIILLPVGTFARDFAYTLEDVGVVRSSFALHVILKLRGDTGKLVPGEYLFEGRPSVFSVARRIAEGDFQTPQKRVTLPEGTTNVQMASLIKATFPDFDSKAFLASTTDLQGYLFPDTYFFQSTSTEDIITILRRQFDVRTRELQNQAAREGKDWNDVVILASILEEESNTDEDNRLIAGLLLRRLSIGMPLQVDVSLVTYERQGLPPAPISNPGIATIDAVLNPVDSPYLYYLTGRDGLMHYALTYDEHRDNIEKYLRR